MSINVVYDNETLILMPPNSYPFSTKAQLQPCVHPQTRDYTAP
jgi:hypothetical protein